MREASIGVFDSGVGGLSVLRELRLLLPREALIYIADQAHVPYGQRSLLEIRHYAVEITRFLLAQRIKILVVACNTASAAALNFLRDTFPDLPIVGMEPAVKPAARQTRNGQVGVLATAVTFESERYASLMQRFARHVTVIEDPCVGLVDRIEAGAVYDPGTRALLERILTPLLAQDVDTLVLGCTHYPFVQPLIREIVGPEINLIDPAPAVAQQTARQLAQHELLAPGDAAGATRLYTSGNPLLLAQFAAQMIGYEGVVTPLLWQDGSLRDID